MENSAGSRLLTNGVRIAFMGLLGFALAGCFPESESDAPNADEIKTSNSDVGGYAQVAKEKLRNSGAAADDEWGEQVRGSFAQEATVFAAGTTSLNAETGAPQIPRIEDIPEVPANVALNHFFSQLAKLEKGVSDDPVTVLHVGDSHIAADRFSGSLREQFQSRFGDAGRGMLTPGLYLARSVKFDRGGKWRVQLSTGEAEGPYGVTGAKLTASRRDAWLRLTAKEDPFSWSEVTLDSGPDNGTLLISLDGELKEVDTQGAEQSWRNIRLERSARELMLRPKGDGPVTIHSISVGNDKPGVRYVNLGLPGATALTPLTWSEEYLEGDLQRLSPDLVIFSYGTGESFNNALNLRDYEARASVAIARMRRYAPKASLLVIGPPDVSQMPKFASNSVQVSNVCRALSESEREDYEQRIKAGDPRLARWHPPVNLAPVRATLRRLAAAHNALFWDWSKLMGGPCGIHAWVHSKPPLAAKDHIHLTEEGSKRSARLLFREIMTAYDAAHLTTAAKE